MKQTRRTTVYDPALGIEAYRLQGFPRPFPPHFHDYYVIGYVAAGTRRMVCGGQAWTVRRGDLLVFQPGEVHACVQAGRGSLSYRGLNIPPAVMEHLAGELTGAAAPPRFSPPVLTDPEAAGCLRFLHLLVMAGEPDFRREELLMLLVSRLLQLCGQTAPAEAPACRAEIAQLCGWMERHFAQRLDLDTLCRRAHLSKSTLLRAFVQARGMTPCRYLESLRVSAARRLLEQGVPPTEAALEAGFADQSHLTHAFSRYLGVTPGAYQASFPSAEIRKRG